MKTVNVSNLTLNQMSDVIDSLKLTDIPHDKNPWYIQQDNLRKVYCGKLTKPLTWLQWKWELRVNMEIIKH